MPGRRSLRDTLTIALALALCAACAATPVDSRYYECERGGPLQVTLRDDTATVAFDDRRYVLARVEAPEGERWAADDVLLWIRKGEASVSVGDQVLVWGCRRR